MVVDKALVAKIAKLAKLEFSEDEQEKLALELSSILQHMRALEEVNIDGVTPVFCGCIEEEKLSDDKVQVFDPEPIISTSPYIQKKLFCVPSILEDAN